ncbi:class I SAM-dependent methyltransferase [Maridesulfovibrio bastinii]|uniref:class I SAM-dependent methyltransferase n=1 Tax=Maridesulfovibrio bastinii TaxID=47157 RepID=UPI000485BA3A|nr:class I SAM-dependent methyltransferase [Maridesulfovibrio bastinii]
MSCTNYMEYWDKEGSQKNFSTPFQLEEFKSHVATDKKVLDVGCGYGRIMKKLIAAGYENVTGIEPSRSLRERASKESGDCKIVEFDGMTIPFNDSSFDAVVLAAVLTSIPRDEDQERLLAEISRVLKDEGILYVNDFLLNEDSRNLERYAKFHEKYGRYGIFELYDGGVTRHHSLDRINALFSGFKTVVFENIVYTTMNGNKSNGFYYLGRLG